MVAPGPMPSDPHSLLGALPRRSAFAREAAGRGAAEQVLAANVDTVWVVQGLDLPPNLRRLERYLAVAWESGAAPEVVLTKADLAGRLDAAVADVSEVAVGVRPHAVSVHNEASVQALRATLAPGRTVALLGPSGAGKSTLVNRLAGETLASTGEVRPTDHKGRHTTTRRALFQVPGGALLLDTAGLRELRIWDVGEGLASAFPEVEARAATCRFRDCAHEAEPGCAVLQAVAEGHLDPGRRASFRKLRAEAELEARKSDPRARPRSPSTRRRSRRSSTTRSGVGTDRHPGAVRGEAELAVDVSSSGDAWHDAPSGVPLPRLRPTHLILAARPRAPHSRAPGTRLARCSPFQRGEP